ncbi:hypothetical protein [Novipirellula caenicola]|uniref:Uncharacterized protein n=1 Tax=Novipirellula caenicola TaxID=1536901 RepID=A0ABP9VYI0_9BACT
MTPEDSYDVPVQTDVDAAEVSATDSQELDSNGTETYENQASYQTETKLETDTTLENEAYEDVDSGDDIVASDSAADDAEISVSEESESDVDQQEIVEAKQAWDEDDPRLAELAQPFVGQWNQLISTTNWEKGEIVHRWRLALIESGAPSTEYSDEAWARRVGGVTAPHVGRLRRVFDRFGSTRATYDKLYWSHFLAALDWDDAPLWLEGAVQESWSVSQMREKRWEATGAVESQRPTNSQIVEVDTDEDVVLPAQGGGRTKDFDEESAGEVATGPRPEGPDFGDEEEFSAMDASKANPPMAEAESKSESVSEAPSISQPFAGLPELPDDLADAIESLKLAVLRHKSAKWEQTDAETIERYLVAIGILLKS